MVFKHTYEEMLEQAYRRLLEIIHISERFEIPEVNSIVQGNKTILKNYKQVARALRRKEEHFIKFMLRELATTGEPRGGDYIFMGKFHKNFLQEKVNKYTREFVLCDRCGKPDTKLEKEGNITYKICEACGAKSVVRTIK